MQGSAGGCIRNSATAAREKPYSLTVSPLFQPLLQRIQDVHDVSDGRGYMQPCKEHHSNSYHLAYEHLTACLVESLNVVVMAAR